MPRNINLETLHWKDETEYAAKELGVGTEVREDDRYYGAFHDDSKNGYRVAVATFGDFEWEMADDEDKKPSAALNAKADEIFHWAEENLNGKWVLFEHFAYRFSHAYAHYVIEDKADRDKFAQKWGDVFTYKQPTVQEHAPVMTEFEKAQQQRIQESLKKAFEASAKIMPLYKGLPEWWTFVSARIDEEDKLFILPNDQIGDLTSLYGNTIEKNMVTQLATILEGRNNFTAGETFVGFVKNMISGTGRDMFRAREVDGYRFSMVAKNNETGQEESYGGDSSSLSDFRRAYREGWDITFNFGTTSFTFNLNNPLVVYRESEHGGIAVSDGYGGMTRGEYNEGVTGQYSRFTGLPEGEWTRTTNVSGGTSYKGPQTAKAIYENGRLMEGSLQPLGSYSDKYQPAPPKLTVLGRKKAVTP